MSLQNEDRYELCVVILCFQWRMPTTTVVAAATNNMNDMKISFPFLKLDWVRRP